MGWNEDQTLGCSIDRTFRLKSVRLNISIFLGPKKHSLWNGTHSFQFSLSFCGWPLYLILGRIMLDHLLYMVAQPCCRVLIWVLESPFNSFDHIHIQFIYHKLKIYWTNVPQLKYIILFLDRSSFSSILLVKSTMNLPWTSVIDIWSIRSMLIMDLDKGKKIAKTVFNCSFYSHTLSNHKHHKALNGTPKSITWLKLVKTPSPKYPQSSPFL